MQNSVKVEGKDNLVKDLKSGAVVNNDASGLAQAKALKKKFMDSENRQKVLEDKINRIEELLINLVENKGIYGSK